MSHAIATPASGPDLLTAPILPSGPSQACWPPSKVVARRGAANACGLASQLQRFAVLVGLGVCQLPGCLQ